MKAVAYRSPGASSRPDALLDIDLPDPVAQGRDLLVEVKAISINPHDVQTRAKDAPPNGECTTLGWDAAGVVRTVGPETTLFKPGDEVAYAGSAMRPGTNAQLHLVDERIVGRKPKSLDWGEAAALPLTSITAWEALFDRLDVHRPVPGAANAILIIGGAGGVPSIAVQLVRQLTDLTVIATSSRPETREWIEEMGAHHVVDHSRPMAAQIEALGLGAPAFVFSTSHTDGNIADIAALISPQGRVAVIDDSESLDVMPLMMKAVSLHWELMFTRSMFETPDMEEQGRLLNEIADLVDAGRLRTTMTERLSPIRASTVLQAHVLVESGKMRGKVVVEGWNEASLRPTGSA